MIVPSLKVALAQTLLVWVTASLAGDLISRPQPLGIGVSPPGQVSADGACGNGVTCLGSNWGQCCSAHGYCGSDDAYCGAGCNSAFGICGGHAAPAGSASSSGGATATVTATSWATATETVTVGSGGAGGPVSVRVVTFTATSVWFMTSTTVTTITSTSVVTTVMREAACASTAAPRPALESTTIRPGKAGVLPSPTFPGVVSNCEDPSPPSSRG